MASGLFQVILSNNAKIRRASKCIDIPRCLVEYCHPLIFLFGFLFCELFSFVFS